MGVSFNPLASVTTPSNSSNTQNASSNSTTGSSAASDPAASLANEQVFLRLLVAQIQNQDPLNPTDSVQFVTQLAQFSQVEQTLAVRQDTDGILSQVTTLANDINQQTTTTSPADTTTPAATQN